jgi:hypothetical protein
MADTLTNPFLGKWTYRSFFNNPDINASTDSLLFGEGTLEFTDAPMGQVAGTIGGPLGQPGQNWLLHLEGWISFGNPMTARFEGTGTVGGDSWVYDYECYYVHHWPNGVEQVDALVGSVIRTVPHPDNGGVGPAGFVASFYAVRQPPIG